MKKPHLIGALCAVVLSFTTPLSQATIVNGFANGGFETNSNNTAANWNGVFYTISTYSHSGSYAMRLASPAINAAIGWQNSVEQGGLPPLTPGDNPIFSFWVTGVEGTTGNLNWALRYLDSVGNILADSEAQYIDGISWDSWTEITYDLGVVPEGATAAFFEIVQAIGPFSDGIVIIDDVFLGVQAVDTDSDSDGVPDNADNCIQAANADQRDTNSDGIGNQCDADLDNDCTVNFIDLGLLKSVFFTNDADADFNGDGSVNFSDLGIMKQAIFLPPGPSGVPNVCDGS